ncbi:dienelactone hydrolase family protein [Pseudomarimonas salicorniae]|uniref:Dienelactone hydrolase family protein n=1 Tax=Pseudomarimonas salicorniae TaxID=2933270 RepID=A0ABT0GE31_9GAMM|nr:dienelactone hydrolase family protein [Lysobacter sp. CAU 1642]MCK7592806.1 dienelactone hydrolase family protein [Lysobacter sp. CAU 1642]
MKPQPPRLTHHDFDPQVLVLFDAYVHGELDRRGFLSRVGELVGAAAAVGVLGALAPSFAQAQQVPEDDARLTTSRQEFDSPAGHGRGRGYRVLPAEAKGPLPRVLVIHENRGLNPHIEDVTRRLGLAGYDAFAPDALFPLGGYPGNEDEARSLFATLQQDKCRADFLAAAAWFEAQDGGNGRLGAVGFCYGGAITSFLATELPQLNAAAPFYGGPAPADKVAGIKAELLVVLAAEDPRINDAWPPYREALTRHGISFSLFQPPDTVHGFHNDTTPRYSEAAAREAWKRTLELFARRLAT